MNPQSRKIYPLPLSGCLLSLLLCGGCETDLGGLKPPPGQRAAASQMGVRNEAVPSSTVPKYKAWNDAETIAGREKGRAPLAGGGISMNPVYGENTMLVVKPIDFAQLKAGMTVVYLNSGGRRVAHQLIAKEGGGWRSQGINNYSEDKDLVTPQNYIGVVYMSLAAEGPMVIP